MTFFTNIKSFPCRKVNHNEPKQIHNVCKRPQHRTITLKTQSTLWQRCCHLKSDDKMPDHRQNIHSVRFTKEPF